MPKEKKKKDPENSWEIIFHFARISSIHASQIIKFLFSLPYNPSQIPNHVSLFYKVLRKCPSSPKIMTFLFPTLLHSSAAHSELVEVRGWGFLSQSEGMSRTCWVSWLAAGAGTFPQQLMTLPPSGFSEVSYSENVSVRRGSIMKRLAGTVLGLLFAQVCCELGLPQRGIWRTEQLLYC